MSSKLSAPRKCFWGRGRASSPNGEGRRFPGPPSTIWVAFRVPGGSRNHHLWPQDKQAEPVSSLIHSRKEGEDGPSWGRRRAQASGRAWAARFPRGGSGCPVGSREGGGTWAFWGPYRRSPHDRTRGAFCETGGEGRPWPSGSRARPHVRSPGRNPGLAEPGVRSCEREEPGSRGLCAPGAHGGLCTVCGAETRAARCGGTATVAWARGSSRRPRAGARPAGSSPRGRSSHDWESKGPRGWGRIPGHPASWVPPGGRGESSAGRRPERRRKKSGVGPGGTCPTSAADGLPHPGRGRPPRAGRVGNCTRDAPPTAREVLWSPADGAEEEHQVTAQEAGISLGGDRLCISMSFLAPACSLESDPDSPAPPLWITRETLERVSAGQALICQPNFPKAPINKVPVECVPKDQLSLNVLVIIT